MDNNELIKALNELLNNIDNEDNIYEKTKDEISKYLDSVK